MKALDVVGENFCGYDEINIPLYKQGLIGVTGKNLDTAAAVSNGSGKSNFFKAISWCWFGKYIDNKVGNDVIKDGRKHSVIESRIELEDGIWKIRRERRKDQPRLFLIQPSGAEWPGEKSDVQAKIDKMLSMDFHTFRNVVLYAEGDTKRFASVLSKDSDRKDILHVIMRTEKLRACRTVIKELVSGFKSTLSDLVSKIESKASMVAENERKISDLTSKKDAYSQSQSDRAKEALEECRSLLSELQELEKERSKEDELKRTLVQLESKKVNVTSIRAEMEKGIIDRNEFQNKLGELNKRIGRTKALLETKRDAISGLDKDVCPTCTSPLDSGAPKLYKESLISEHHKLEDELVALNKRSKQLRSSYDENEENIKSCREKIESGLKINTNIQSVRDELDSLRLLDGKSKELGKRVQAKRDSAKAIKEEANPYGELIEDLENKNASHKSELKTMRIRRKEVENDLAHHEFWTKGFSDQGLPSYVLDSVMPFITERTNYYLDTLSDGDIRVMFDTQRQLKSSKGATRDEISMTWEIEGLSNYPPSSGQQRKITISAELALGDLVSSREGGKPDLLLLDEIFDGLDKEGAARVGLVLQKLRKDCGTIYVITHDPNVSDFFDRNLEVIRQNKSSKVVEVI